MQAIGFVVCTVWRCILFLSDAVNCRRIHGCIHTPANTLPCHVGVSVGVGVYVTDAAFNLLLSSDSCTDDSVSCVCVCCVWVAKEGDLIWFKARMNGYHEYWYSERNKSDVRRMLSVRLWASSQRRLKKIEC